MNLSDTDVIGSPEHVARNEKLPMKLEAAVPYQVGEWIFSTLEKAYHMLLVQHELHE